MIAELKRLIVGVCVASTCLFAAAILVWILIDILKTIAQMVFS